MSLDGKVKLKHSRKKQSVSHTQPTSHSQRGTSPSSPTLCEKVESFDDYVNPIQEAINELLVPTLFGQSEPFPSELRQLVTLTTAQGGMGIPDLKLEAPQQFVASVSITTAHVHSITSQSTFMTTGERSTVELKRHHQSLKTARAKERMEHIDNTLSPDLLRLVNQARDKGASCKLMALNKQEFRDSLP
mgnify:CR=1 FL=1